MRAAQEAAVAGARTDVPGALRALRQSVAAITRAAGAELRDAGRPPDAAGITERLNAVAADVVATAALRAGVLVDTGSAGPTDATDRSPAPRSRRSAERAAPAVADDDTAARAETRRRLTLRGAELDERRAEIERDLRDTERAEAEARATHAAALTALEQARVDVSAADDRLADATERRDQTARMLAEHERQHERWRREIEAFDRATAAPAEQPGRAIRGRPRSP